jgi:sulfite exporter TauE/SafE
MSLTLAGTALLLGLAGAPHCTAMCGALQAAAIGRVGGPRWPALAGLQAGRLTAYAVGGAVVAASTSAIGTLTAGASALRPVWTLWHVAALLFGAALLATGRLPRWLAEWARPRPQAAPGLVLAGQAPVGWYRRLPAPARSAGLGACWLALPCGLLQSALIVASLASGPFDGAAVMLAFGTGTTAGLVWLGGWSGGRSGWLGERWAAWWAASAIRIAGAALVAASGAALWLHLRTGVADALCR